MAAYTTCMCVIRSCKHLRFSQTIARAMLTEHCHINVLPACARKSLFLPSGLMYSSQTTDSESDQNLKEKLADHESTDNQPSSSGTGSDKDKDSGKKDGKWTGKNAWKLGLVFLSGWGVFSGGFLIYSWGSPQVDPEGNEIEDEYSQYSRTGGMIRRALKEMNLFAKKIQDPSRERLLPDPLEYPYIQPPYTLVLEMTGVLVHPDWTYGTGWRFKKRPGVDYFLNEVKPPLFEVVIYSSEGALTADPIVNSLDPHGSVMYRLYRDATRYMNGHHIKDLGCLNRDLNKVIMIDWDHAATQLQPTNTLRIPKWSGSDDDRTLIDLVSFLKTIAVSEVDDVRKVLEHYSQFDDPIGAFKENQRRLQEEQERMDQEIKEQEDKRKKNWGGGLASVFKIRK